MSWGAVGSPGGGGRASAPIAGIAEIARHRRNREGKGLPLIHADDADRKAGRSGHTGKEADKC
jgi:hypothetical protein